MTNLQVDEQYNLTPLTVQTPTDPAAGGSGTSIKSTPVYAISQDGQQYLYLPEPGDGIVYLTVHEPGGGVRVIYESDYTLTNDEIFINADANILAGDEIRGKYWVGAGSGTGGAGKPVAAVGGLVVPKPKIELARLFGPNGTPTLTTMDTPHYLRLSFSSDVSYLKDLSPEIWIFRYGKATAHLKTGGRVKKAKWVHPTHGDGSRHVGSAFFAGDATNRTSEFFDPNIVTAVTNNTKIDIKIEGREWFKMIDPQNPQRPQAAGKKGFVQRLKLALVVDDPTSKSGKRFSELSDEVYLTPTSYYYQDTNGNQTSTYIVS